MPTQTASLENDVRHLRSIGWSQRRVARYLRTSQSTVSRTEQKINTGPQPILAPDAGPPTPSPPPRPPEARNRGGLIPAMVLAVALLLIAAISANVIWVRWLHAPAPVQVTACVKYNAAGNVTGLAGGGRCPAGWRAVVLTPVP